MSECVYRMAAWACDPAAYSKVKREVSVQITSRTKARRAEAHKEFNESQVLQSGDKQAVCQSHFFTHLWVLKSASRYQTLPGEIFPFLLLRRTKKCYKSNIPTTVWSNTEVKHPCQSAWNVGSAHLITLHISGCKTSIIYSFTQTDVFTRYIVSASSYPGAAICSPLYIVSSQNVTQLLARGQHSPSHVHHGKIMSYLRGKH